jgi:hypothetical protein
MLPQKVVRQDTVHACQRDDKIGLIFIFQKLLILESKLLADLSTLYCSFTHVNIGAAVTTNELFMRKKANVVPTLLLPTLLNEL